MQERRQIRFTGIDKIVKFHMPIKQYTLEAIEIEKLGLKIDFKKLPCLTFFLNLNYYLMIFIN